MDALKNFLVLISVIIGLTATAAFAEEEADVVFGPRAASAIEQSEETKIEENTSASVPTLSVDAMLLVRKNLI